MIRKLGVVKYDGDTPERLESTAKIAEIVASMTPAHKPVYNLILCNCEVFALWCRTPWRFVPFLIDVPILPPMISKKILIYVIVYSQIETPHARTKTLTPL